MCDGGQAGRGYPQYNQWKDHFFVTHVRCLNSDPIYALEVFTVCIKHNMNHSMMAIRQICRVSALTFARPLKCHILFIFLSCHGRHLSKVCPQQDVGQMCVTHCWASGVRIAPC